MKIPSKNTVLMFVTFSSLFICNNAFAQKKDQMVRIAEIEIEHAHLDEYKKILKEESEASVRLEPGVIAIFPMFEKENPNRVRILEIYADKEAYQAHLKTPHFLLYKNSTLKMVKSLKLVEMDALDVKTMPVLFRKYD
ncbi:putative quinol monooxygenase [Flavobacterium hercynium]|uniref:Antibiotic biosynthesis monooxygenase n=1 Tax=Flavobacterium hercynium TaxID=387094 RepID=A0A226H6X5_9FLAO|nr:putative quinol monooxygenase [Flavobacterium hercynium]OXA89975.1 antibiotic biosynthesis monooxygenase [Flavobacterium hercynium]SMP14042.1 Quinol monooxygenase YgiN [Flavobacterium hercynium]